MAEESDLEAELAGLEADGLAGELMSPDLTVGEFLDHWVEGHVRHAVRSATYASYEGCIRLHIKPHLEKYRLRDVTSGHIRALYSLLEKKKLPPRTRLLVHQILRRSLGHAERWEVIPSNPAKRVDESGGLLIQAAAGEGRTPEHPIPRSAAHGGDAASLARSPSQGRPGTLGALPDLGDAGYLQPCAAEHAEGSGGGVA